MCGLREVKLSLVILFIFSGCQSISSTKSSDVLKSSTVDDFGELAWCVTGPDVAPMRGCEGYDIDADFDVDLYDWAGWTLEDPCLVAICEVGTCVQGHCLVE